MPALTVLILTKISQLQAFLTEKRAEGSLIGFVPTMGALHEGHISLIEAAKKDCDITVCSVFVNPTQFNDKKDLERYPKTPGEDIKMLEKAGCDAVFMPDANEIYPEKDLRVFDFGHLDKILEGAHRPGHFNGVAQVVSILFDIVQPDKAYFGSKDYQQVMVIRELVKMLQYKIDIVACPTLRESDGLAMSSRNTLLTPEEREAAKIIPRIMNSVKDLKAKGNDIRAIKEIVAGQLKSDIYKLDYFAICDAESLKELNSFSEARRYVTLIACFVGRIRLIDNIVLD
ncbi:MAG: pantoate--beta-alanine ligase [Bacteroidetes bacterium]|nr:pantoate--beta-alanine ligase [Bacteroidota bacterium]